MKRWIGIAAAAVLVLVVSTVVLAKEAHKGAPHVSGTITSWDDATKHGTIKDSAGNEKSFGWNDQTVVTGTPKVGEHASVAYTKDKDGKVMATQVHIGAASKPTTK